MAKYFFQQEIWQDWLWAYKRWRWNWRNFALYLKVHRKDRRTNGSFSWITTILFLRCFWRGYNLSVKRRWTKVCASRWLHLHRRRHNNGNCKQRSNKTNENSIIARDVIWVFGANGPVRQPHSSAHCFSFWFSSFQFSFVRACLAERSDATCI